MSRFSKGERRRAEILVVGLQVWRDQGRERVTANYIASLIGITHSAVLYYTKKKPLVDMIADFAVEMRCRTVVPQLIACGHSAAQVLSREDRQQFMSLS